MSPTEYDATVRDLVNFLVYVGEPAAADRKAIGIVVLFVARRAVHLRLPAEEGILEGREVRLPLLFPQEPRS